MADPFLCGLLFRLRYALRVQVDSDAARPIFLRGMNEDPSIAAAEVVYNVAWLDVGELQHRFDDLVGRRDVDHVGRAERRLLGLVNLSVEGVEGEAMLLKLAGKGIAASSGSSCLEQTGKPSHVLLAMGVAPELARSSVLLAVGRDNTAEEMRRVMEAFPDAVRSLRAISVGCGA